MFISETTSFQYFSPRIPNIGHPTSGSGGEKTVKQYLKSEHTDRQMDRRTDGQTDRQTDISTYRKHRPRGPMLWKYVPVWYNLWIVWSYLVKSTWKTCIETDCMIYPTHTDPAFSCHVSYIKFYMWHVTYILFFFFIQQIKNKFERWKREKQ